MKTGSGRSPRFRTVAVLAALLGRSAFAAPQEEEQASQLTCYQLAMQQGFADEYYATPEASPHLASCRGSGRSDGSCEA